MQHQAYRGILFLCGFVKAKEGTRSAHFRSQHNGHDNAGQQFDIHAGFDKCRPKDALSAAASRSKSDHVGRSDAFNQVGSIRQAEKPNMRFSIAS